MHGNFFRRTDALFAGYGLILSLAVVAPLLAPGYLLLRDAVSTPRSYLSDAALGLTEAAPRALPQDFAVAGLSAVVDGGIVVKVLLVAGLWLAGWGAARLLAAIAPDAGAAGGLVSATVAVWNPYVFERLVQGHWSLLVGYGCLPWVAAAMLRVRDGSVPGGWWSLAFFTALAGLTPTGLMLAATVALACCAVPGPTRRWWCAAGALGVAVLAALPWLVASAVGGSAASTEPSGIAAFAARAEPGLGMLGSLLGLGGIWNADAVPDSRTTLFAVVATAVLVGVVAVGAVSVWRHPAAAALLVLAAAAVVIPAAMATGPGIAVVEAVVREMPGLGVVRDGQKWVALAMPGYAVAAGGAVLTLRRWVRPAVTALVCCLAVVVVLPDLVWGAAGRVTAVDYPAGWSTVSAAIDADPRPVAVLPADSMRRFAWSGEAPVLDPLPRWVRSTVLSTGDLNIAGETVPGEGESARDVQRLLLDGAPPSELERAGVGWIVVETGTPGEIGSAATTLAQLPVVYRDDDLALYRVGGLGQPTSGRPIMIAAHLGWLAVLVAGAAGMAAGVRRRR